MTSNTEIIEILESFWPRNKAKGLLAQTIFMEDIKSGTFGNDGKEKIVPGCWLLAPKGKDFYRFRFSFFVHPEVVKTGGVNNNPKPLLGDLYRPFHAIAEFMNNAGIGVIYAVPSAQKGKIDYTEIRNKNFNGVNWDFFYFRNGEFVHRDYPEFFDKWEGDRGRAGHGGNWDPEIKRKIESLDKDVLIDLFLNEVFYTGLVKSVLKKPVNDPYDVDSFLISISQRNMFPVEIKEKFPGTNGNEKFFGIDAGRIMMMLRLCLPNDSNAIYLIRELDENGNFVSWKYITLSDIIMTSSWNLQAGGIGMGGQNTQTIRLPYEYFKPFNKSEISEDNLKRIGSLPKDIKEAAKKFGIGLSKFD